MAKRELKTKKTEEQIVEENAAVVEETVPTIGVVTGCSKLNVRKKPNINSDVIVVVNAGSELTIDVDKSHGEWYKVTDQNNNVGYCMKKYVKVN